MTWTTNCRLLVARGASAVLIEIPCVTLKEFIKQPVYADDGRTMIGVRNTIRGRGIFAGPSAYEAFNNATCNPGTETGADGIVSYRLEVRDPGEAWPGTPIAEYSRSVMDDIGGPHFVATGSEALGTQCIVVEFEIDSQVNDASYATGVPVVGHTWTQTCAIQGDGRIERTVRGMLRTAPSIYNASQQDTVAASSAASDWKGVMPLPDLMRFAIVPPLPGPGWRRQNAEFLVTEDGAGLAYQIVDTQNRTNLPYPALAGEMEFSYERSFPNLGWADCSLRCHLEGAISTGFLPLIATAWDLMKVRVAPVNNIITRMKVTEHSMVDRVSCTCELGMRVYATNFDDDGTLAIAAMVGKQFEVSRAATNQKLPVYGASPSAVQSGGGALTQVNAWQMPPHWLANVLNAANTQSNAPTMPQATLVEVTVSADPTTASVITVHASSTEALDAVNTSFGGAFTQPYPKQANTSGGFPTMIHEASSFSVQRVGTGMVRMCSAELSAPDWTFQTQKPRVRLVERVEVVQQGVSPNRPMRAIPTGALVEHEDWRVSSGAGDAQKNLVFTGIFERVYTMLDDGASATGFATVTSSGVTRREWQPPYGQLVAARNPGLGGGGQNADTSAFGPQTDDRLASFGTISGYLG